MYRTSFSPGLRGFAARVGPSLLATLALLHPVWLPATPASAAVSETAQAGEDAGTRRSRETKQRIADRYWLISALGAAGALGAFGVGGYFWSQQAEAKSKAEACPDDEIRCRLVQEDQAASSGTLALASFAVGGVALIGATGFAYLASQESPRATEGRTLGLLPAPGGLVLVGSF